MKNLLMAEGFDVHLPQDEEPKNYTPSSLFASDVMGIDKANFVIAVMDGSDPDSGTSWEVGYAYAKRIPIILLRTDIRNCDDGTGVGDGVNKGYNLMLWESSERRFNSIYDIIAWLKK